ncbi:putative CoA-binding protein [Desulfosporosinus acidiphilus SJ4]|uniref:Putative CoA-binding protein n=1 Tax=Desulfosporosinus acidiphilus (strain DSM 22704 / JCM 16185 / SJ4) TaxID=646529 RepID=I4D8T1_DESAJ|nr:CoA-binding protein [Desulfosporosinus acidiphilus]AFM42205.1 putative CoA-binding protein [Desulfosporosinus acidiphilus SJ4]
MVREKTIFPFTEGITTADTFAVLGNAQKFKTHKHAWKTWKTLKEFGCLAYPVADDLKRLDGSKVYPSVTELKGKVTVVVPCLLPENLPSLVSEVILAGAEKIWFQEQTWSQAFQEECEKQGVQVIRGCVLRHKRYPALSLCYLNPCYWHGLRDLKVPAKRSLR